MVSPCSDLHPHVLNKHLLNTYYVLVILLGAVGAKKDYLGPFGLLEQNTIDWGLKQQTVLLKAGSPRSGCRQTPCLARAGFPACSGLSTHCILMWWGE